MVCSVTRLGVHLLHAEPLDCRRLMIAVTIDSGEVLRMIVAVRSTSRQGGRYKTIARFLTTESPQGEE